MRAIQRVLAYKADELTTTSQVPSSSSTDDVRWTRSVCAHLGVGPDRATCPPPGPLGNAEPLASALKMRETEVRVVAVGWLDVGCVRR